MFKKSTYDPETPIENPETPNEDHEKIIESRKKIKNPQNNRYGYTPKKRKRQERDDKSKDEDHRFSTSHSHSLLIKNESFCDKNEETLVIDFLNAVSKDNPEGKLNIDRYPTHTVITRESSSDFEFMWEQMGRFSEKK